MNRFFALIGATWLMLALVSVAFAHAEIESCTPAIGSTVTEPPAQLICKASQGMEPKESKLSVFDANGMQVDQGDSQVDLNDPDRTTIMVSLDTAKIKPGVYVVKWVTLSNEDGEKDEGEFTFTVGSGASVTPAAVTPTGASPSPTVSATDTPPSPAPSPTSTPTGASAPPTLPSTGAASSTFTLVVMAGLGALLFIVGTGLRARR